MATSSKIHLSPAQQLIFYLPGISASSADKASKLLQENHEQHHIFFNHDGYHNHIVHHLLTTFALRADPDTLQNHYDNNKGYQRLQASPDKANVEDMRKPQTFKACLGVEKLYSDWLLFFKDELAKKGPENVLNEYVFCGDERADDLLVRLFAGFLHPIIHLGFGVEFEQPAIIAEALALTAVHDNWIGALFDASEKAVKGSAGQGSQKQNKPLAELIEQIGADEVLSNAAHWDDANKVRDGIMKRAPKRMVEYASQYTVGEAELEEKVAEMINAAVLFTGAAQHPPNVVKFDFYYMHCVNASIFFSLFLSSSSRIPRATKVRLLEWKVRLDLAMYASRRSPPLRLDEITQYRSKHASQSPSSAESPALQPWSTIFERAAVFPDDGHSSKLIRALAHGERACKPYENRDGFRIKGDMWLSLANMVMDSVEADGPHWVRSAGFEEAWANMPLREGVKM